MMLLHSVVGITVTTQTKDLKKIGLEEKRVYYICIMENIIHQFKGKSKTEKVYLIIVALQQDIITHSQSLELFKLIK